MRTRKLCLPPGPLFVFLLAFAIISPRALAQSGEWAWMGGNSVIPSGLEGPPGVYGKQGVANAANTPGGREDAASWTDKQGNLWLFGGRGEDANAAFGFLNDLWEFNVTSKEWTWISGSSNRDQPGVYGQLGTPGKNNAPGSRSGAFGWIDRQGNLWLFGGAGLDSVGATVGYLNDLWEYNTVSGEWTWMGGSSTASTQGVGGVYGTLGSLTSGSYPGGRGWGAEWTDSQGNFWMFGGWGMGAQGSGLGALNDLWKFVPSTQQWAWMSGNSTFGGTGWYGTYGQLGTPASGNTPGARDYLAYWMDSGGNLWLFGGVGYSLYAGSGQPYNGELNDLWEFSPTTNEWAWMGGTSLIVGSGFPRGVNGTLGTFSAANIPGSRAGSFAWVDSAGNAWLIGGSGIGASSGGGAEDDIWEFNPAINEWAWMGSLGTRGVYGTSGVAAPGNIPGGRSEAASWTGLDGSFWLMGGDGPDASGTRGNLNDLWEYQAELTAPAFNLPAGTYTSTQLVSLSDATSGATIYYTTNGTTPTTNSAVYSAPIAVNSSETIEAIATASGYSISPVASAAYTIPPDFSVAATPSSQTVAGGQYATTSISITPAHGFNSAVSFSCSGLPFGATCIFSPQTVTPSNGVASTTLNITTTLSMAMIHRRANPLFPISALAALVCCIGWKRRRLFQILPLLALGVIGFSLLNGCGSVNSGGTSSAPQSATYTITVNAASASLQHSTSFSLTVN